jgi:hypothetical protein
MELTPFIKIVASLGVPGLVVGIIYVMLRAWSVKVAAVPARQAHRIVALIIVVVGGLTYAVIVRVFPDAPPKQTQVERDLRFETQYERATFYELGPNKVRGNFVVRFLPTITDNGQAATIFAGMVKFADDERVADVEAWSRNTKSCDDSQACVHPPVVFHWEAEHERIIRGDTKGTTHTFSAVFDRNVKRLLVYWEFYQREGDNGGRCEIDTSRRIPLDGLPYVRVVKNGKPTTYRCYRAWERQVIPVAIGV